MTRTRARALVLAASLLSASIAASACGPVAPETSDDSDDTPSGPEAPPGVVIASAQNTPTAIVADDTGVYWIDAGVQAGSAYAARYVDGSLMKASLDGSGVTPVVTHLDALVALAVDPTTIYWTSDETGSDGSPAGAVRSVKKDGSDPIVLVPARDAPGLVAVDDANVYWTESSDGGESLMKARKDGSAVTTLAQLGDVSAMTLDDGWVYLIESARERVVKVDENGGSPIVLATDEGCDGRCPSGLAVSDDSVYWGAGSAIMRMGKDGSDPTPILAPQPSTGLAFADGSLFWASGAEGDDVIATATADGEGETPLAFAAELATTGPIAVGPTAVYWTTRGARSSDLVGQGDVMMIAR